MSLSTAGDGPPSYHHSENADVYARNASFVYSDENTRAVLKLLNPEPGDVILDVGCGTGVLTARLAALVSPGGQVIGIDASEDMITKATKTLKYSAHDVRCEVCDAHDLEAWLDKRNLTGTFDKVFSNATLHWAKRDPSKVARGMAAALREGGSVAVEFGGHMNVIGVRSALHAALAQRGIDPERFDPWFFPTPKEYARIMQDEARLDVLKAELVPRPTPLPKDTGLLGWLKTFAGPFLNALHDPKEQQAVLAEVQERLRCDMYDASEDQWTVMYVRLRILARKAKAKENR